MKIGLALVFIFITTHAAASDCESQIKGAQCLAGFTPTRVVAFFPVLDDKPMWKWNVKERTLERPEYAWIVDSGICRKGKFVLKGIGFAASLGSLNLQKDSVVVGTLSELLNAASKNAFFSVKPNNNTKENEQSELMFRSKVLAKPVEPEMLFVGVVDLGTVNNIKNSNPTHFKMTAILPNTAESYECVAKIENIDMP